MTWNEYKERVAALVPDTVKFRAIDSEGRSRTLFRGQGDSRWNLQSTLERAGYAEMPLARYLGYCVSARRFASNYLPSSIPFEENCECGYELASRHFPNFEYVGFLRHHGFPSPLLDWTESPYVAAFFAFRHLQSGTDKVRIYAYRSHGPRGRGWSADEPTLFPQGPFASIHERHAAQQCWYTVSMKARGEDECVISSHEAAIAITQRDGEMEQDTVEIFDLAVSERPRALADLFSMNVTPFSLFRSPDALMETAAWRLL